MGTTGGGKQEDVSYARSLVASLSSVLKKLVKGNMEEAQKGSVVWEHVDEQTFIRFSHVLTEFMEWDDVADMLIKLLRYCFENDTPAELREFVMRYAVCHIENLWKRKEVIELARTHADFSSAIVEAMLYSLNW
ncbi:hypothetical protein E4U56_002606 [Claviceps arundinis]|uniref:Uncharacterized protein n=1 Tax=Claviceps arundinis TaxID=1623583 RepID=A0A9P7MPZ1_9HYPO|nr:hypothetical protein E4U56_002606 [Claviceps arundinis]